MDAAPATISLHLSLSSQLTHEYSGAVLRLASSFEGLWSLGTASSREGSRPPPSGEEEEEEEIRSSPLPLAATATDRRRRGATVPALRRRLLLLIAAAVPTTMIEEGFDVDAPPHTRRSDEEEDISRLLPFAREARRKREKERERGRASRAQAECFLHFFFPRMAPKKKAKTTTKAKPAATTTTPTTTKDEEMTPAPPASSSSSSSMGEIFSRTTQAVFFNLKPAPIQRMLDFDFVCGKRRERKEEW